MTDLLLILSGIAAYIAIGAVRYEWEQRMWWNRTQREWKFLAQDGEAACRSQQHAISVFAGVIWPASTLSVVLGDWWAFYSPTAPWKWGR